jgi:hypothetical protein
MDDLKPFVAIQPEASFAWMVATPFVKRRQQVPKPRDRAPKFINR